MFHRTIAQRLALCALACLPLASASAASDNYPERAIKLVVPWPPGGATDALGRIMAQHLGQRLGQPVVVDNRAGAGGNIGTTAFLREPADGYALLMATSSTNAANPHLYRTPGFDARQDFAPVAFIAEIPNVLEVPQASPYDSLHALLEDARANPGKLNYGSGGIGSSQHLAGSMLRHRAGIDIVHIPYKGSGPAVSDLMAGQVDMMLDTGSMAHVQAGALKALAVASRERVPALPDVPTFDELGVEGMHASAWYGIVAAAGTPASVIERLNQELNAVLQEPQVREALGKMGAIVAEPGTPAGFGAFMAAEIDRYEEIVRVSGATLD
ncbi:tripartite tricarboxylate transporter substrate binding protein [Verticiella sediminum]|uniref:Tripartite tricarboxylate transporter substrate binding protein n=1 Tax=Verticiella sediminum TaxID=1247510 RepID=A0A556A6I9_9BURK|nr:tripartite tricarboxylate transporter substrate binding protein [Verticiella sediminum]TSH88503.1 tripartite tricarboxylate transporter substrate binding protein [Verticiella sediminum]